jgi:hypothetical protein
MVQSRGKSLRQLFFVPKEVYLGERVVETKDDTVYSYFPEKEKGVGSESLSWQQVMNKYPALDRFPEMSCAYELSVDVKCGIRVLQTVAQVVFEFRTGLFKKAVSSEVRVSTLEIVLSLLESLESKLSNWGLNPERKALEVAAREALESENQLKASEVEKSPKSAKSGTAGRPSAAMTFKQRKDTDPWKPYLQLPNDFWQMMP